MWCWPAKFGVHKHTSSFWNVRNQNNEEHHRLRGRTWGFEKMSGPSNSQDFSNVHFSNVHFVLRRFLALITSCLLAVPSSLPPPYCLHTHTRWIKVGNQKPQEGSSNVEMLRRTKWCRDVAKSKVHVRKVRVYPPLKLSCPEWLTVSLKAWSIIEHQHPLKFRYLGIASRGFCDDEAPDAFNFFETRYESNLVCPTKVLS